MSYTYLFEDLRGCSLNYKYRIKQACAVIAWIFLIGVWPFVHEANYRLQAFHTQPLVMRKHYKYWLHLTKWRRAFDNHIHAWMAAPARHTSVLSLSRLKFFKSLFDAGIVDFVAAIAKHFEHGAAASVEDTRICKSSEHFCFIKKYYY